ncbi:hypothetical protein IKG45_00185 [Candidatus Saccharibacteria bacterium]|nr:hypothetical protein [Candidatus Saccharibacteria bacterium]
MSKNIYEHPGIKLEFKTPEEEANDKKLPPRDIAIVAILFAIIYSLVFIAFFEDFGWWTLLALPVIFILGFGVRLIIELSADPYHRTASAKPLTESMKKHSRVNFQKLFTHITMWQSLNILS